MRFLSETLRTLLLVVAISTTLLPICGVAGFDEGMVAYNLQKSNYAEAIKECEPLAKKGNALAQLELGVMSRDGQGTAQDYKEAVRLFGLAAAQANPPVPE